jgi:hypothetical protein
MQDDVLREWTLCLLPKSRPHMMILQYNRSFKHQSVRNSGENWVIVRDYSQYWHL